MDEPKYKVGDIVNVECRGRVTEVCTKGASPFYWVDTVRLGKVYDMEGRLTLIYRPDSGTSP